MKPSIKYTAADREQAIMLYKTLRSQRKVAKAMNIPLSTIGSWLRSLPADGLDDLREEKRREAVEAAAEAVKQAELDFVDTTTRIMDKGLELLEMMLDDELAARQNGESDGKMTVNQVTTAIGTLYDKRALAKGETTQNAAVTVLLPDDVRMYGE